MLARYLLSSRVCLSVRLSVTSRSCTKMAKRRITLRTAYDSPGTLVFRCQKSRWNSNDITPNGGAIEPTPPPFGAPRSLPQNNSAAQTQYRRNIVFVRHGRRQRRVCAGGAIKAYCYQQRPVEVYYDCYVYFKLTVSSHGSVCISRASCYNQQHIQTNLN